MQDPILRKIFLGFIQVHILHHAKKEPIYGSWMMEELRRHGYEISSGTLYPIFHNLEKNGSLRSEKKLVDGKTRKYYTTTEQGMITLAAAKSKITELRHEIDE